MQTTDPLQSSNILLGIAGVIVSLFAALGVGNMLAAMWSYSKSRKDKKEDKTELAQEKAELLHETNESKKIDANTTFQDRLVHRIEVLEKEQNKLRDDQLNQAIVNTRLQVSEEHLKQENDKQELEIQSLRQDRRDLNNSVILLTREVEILTCKVQDLEALLTEAQKGVK